MQFALVLDAAQQCVPSRSRRSGDPPVADQRNPHHQTPQPSPSFAPVNSAASQAWIGCKRLMDHWLGDSSYIPTLSTGLRFSSRKGSEQIPKEPHEENKSCVGATSRPPSRAL